MDEESLSVIIINAGSSTMKFGYPGESLPRHVFPSTVARSVYAAGTKSEGPTIYKHPIEAGFITNFDDMEKLWYEGFHKLSVSISEHCILQSEPPLNDKKSREKITQLMFELFNVRAYRLAQQPLLALYGSGRTTGVALNIGHTVVNSLPVFEGSVLEYALKKDLYGGSQFTDFLRDLLAQGGNAWPTTAGRDIAEDIKQKICYVASDPQTEANPPIKYTIPSTGEEIRVGDERWKCTEPLFEPSPIIGNNALGVHQMLFESIMASPLDIQRTLSQNIVLSGGTSSFPGFADRLSKQVEPLFKSNEFKITAPPEPQLLSWRGGSVMAEMPGFQRGCMTTAEYDEFGPELVHKKAF